MRTVFWQNNHVRMIDQKRIPWEFSLVDLYDYAAVAESIRDMTVRGAPAIGATAAFGMALAARASKATTVEGVRDDLSAAGDILKQSRPTAVNLMWAVDRLIAHAAAYQAADAEDLKAEMLRAAQQIADDDVATNKRIGQVGAALIKDGDTVLHHCNTGALAAVDYGTALGVIRTAWEQGKRFHVLLDETRPRLQGARLSAWELEQLGISYDIIPDTASGFYMRRGEVKLVLLGADRIAGNGDFANKIGTYQVGVLAKENGIPFYTVAPISTVDLSLSSGDDIPIEERDKSEVLAPFGNAIAPAHYHARNPAFDVTPASYLSGIITENGIVRAPFEVNLPRAAAGEQV
ncbi:MAG: S-methyl-5-thioribose-1-phosphate isomerase [Pleurocapsa minor GSE-CHR-MK-17-07R]|nr:S-methyl-5-thioribose-1-phosphate isomerase [Pleurocapsa minor GSE-CHR-MK 17-07R]